MSAERTGHIIARESANRLSVTWIQLHNVEIIHRYLGRQLFAKQRTLPATQPMPCEHIPHYYGTNCSLYVVLLTFGSMPWWSLCRTRTLPLIRNSWKRESSNHATLCQSTVNTLILEGLLLSYLTEVKESCIDLLHMHWIWTFDPDLLVYNRRPFFPDDFRHDP